MDVCVYRKYKNPNTFDYNSLFNSIEKYLRLIFDHFPMINKPYRTCSPREASQECIQPNSLFSYCLLKGSAECVMQNSRKFPCCSSSADTMVIRFEVLQWAPCILVTAALAGKFRSVTRLLHIKWFGFNEATLYVNVAPRIALSLSEYTL